MARKADDYSLDDQKRRLIRKHAETALRNADALGLVPTPIEQVLEAANLFVSEEPVLELGFLTKLRKDAGSALRRALSKVLGVLDSAARIIYLDKTLHVVKRTFLKLHETAHAVLPWQSKAFIVAEDCAMTLAPEIAELFEREANAFASEVLFQLDSFSEEANDHAVGILVPVRLAKRYRASIYSSVRRYVTGSPRACMVLVLEPPEVCPIRGFMARFRRAVVSDEFRRVIGELSWPDEFGPDDQIGAMVPIGGRRMSRPRELSLRGSNHKLYRCVAEAFTQGHQVFVLIHSVTTLTRKIVRVS